MSCVSTASLLCFQKIMYQDAASFSFYGEMKISQGKRIKLDKQCSQSFSLTAKQMKAGSEIRGVYGFTEQTEKNLKESGNC